MQRERRTQRGTRTRGWIQINRYAERNLARTADVPREAKTDTTEEQAHTERRERKEAGEEEVAYMSEKHEKLLETLDSPLRMCLQHSQLAMQMSKLKLKLSKVSRRISLYVILQGEEGSEERQKEEPTQKQIAELSFRQYRSCPG